MIVVGLPFSPRNPGNPGDFVFLADRTRRALGSHVVGVVVAAIEAS